MMRSDSPKSGVYGNFSPHRAFVRALVFSGATLALSGGVLAQGTADGAPPATARPYDGSKVVRVNIRSAADAKLMAAISEDPWTCRYGGESVFPATGDFRVPGDALDAMKSQGVEYVLLIDDVQGLIDAETTRLMRPARGPGWYSDFKDLAAVNAQLDAWIASHPTMISRVTIGNSVQGRAVPCVRIAAPGTAVNSKPQVFVIGCQHAREWITVMATMYLADNLVNGYVGDTQVQRLLNSFEIYVVPVVNPDGYVHTWPTALGGGGQRLWRKNRRNNGTSFGVDLNRNWAFHWGGVGTSGTPSSDIYRGPSAFSEPESSQIGTFVSALPNLAMFYDVHSYSQLILEPWGDTWEAPPHARSLTQMSAAMQESMYQVGQQTFVAGSGFRVIYATSGVADEWAFGARGSLSSAFELRDTGQFGFVLPADQILPSSQELYAGVTSSLGWMIDNAVSVEFPNGKPARVAASGTTGVLVQFQQGLKKTADLSANVPTVHVRQGRVGPFNAASATNAGTDETGVVFSHTLTGGICGSVVQWYYSVTLADNSTITIPAEGASKPFEAVAQQFTPIISNETFESVAAGWISGDPSDIPATPPPSAWTRVDPQGTQTQVEDDHTPLTGVNCYITGQNARNDTFGLGRVGESSTGANQVQQVSLRSPIMNLGSASEAEVSFWLTYANSRQFAPDDSFRVDFTMNANDAVPTWTSVLSIAPSGPVGETTARWNRYTLRLSAGGGALGANVRLRFVASEDGNGDSVEAALDDFSVMVPVCETPACAGDFSGDGVLGTQDIFDYLSAWFAGSPLADTDTSGTIGVQDLFSFLNAWFAGCD